MNIKLHEDARALRDFYPDPVKRHQVLYHFAHRFLPQNIHKNPYEFFSLLFRRDLPGCPVEPTRFIQSRWTLFEAITGLIPMPDPSSNELPLRRVSELSMTVQDVAGHPIALVKMPEPEQRAEAFFVAAALLAPTANPESWPRDVQARVFTLESSPFKHLENGKAGSFCEWAKADQHRNFGLAVLVDPDAFCKTVTAALRNPDARIAAALTPPKPGEHGGSLYTTSNKPPPELLEPGTH